MTSPYHLNLSTISRRRGGSAVRKAAYNAGERHKDLRTGKTYDYRYKRKGVVAREFVSPDGAAAPSDAAAFFNLVEEQERRWDARVAREFKGAVPHQLSEKARLDVMREFAQFVAGDLSTAVWCCFHKPGRGDDRNFHFHLLFPTRELDGEKLGKKHRHLDSKKTSGAWVKMCREKLAEITNLALEKEGLIERVDHRSNRERGIEKQPGAHLGPKLWWRREKAKAEIRALEKQLAELEVDSVDPLTASEIEAAEAQLHDLMAGRARKQSPFSLAEGNLVIEPVFNRRLEKAKSKATTEPTLKISLADLFATISAAASLAQERWDEEERRRRERGRGREPAAD